MKLIIKKIIFPLLMFHLVAPSPLKAQNVNGIITQKAKLIKNGGPALTSFLETSKEHKTNPDFILKVLDNAHQLEQNQVSVQPYLLKATEGLSKKISPQQIWPALEHTKSQSLQSRSLAQQWTQKTGQDENDLIFHQAQKQFYGAMLNEIKPIQIQHWIQQTNPNLLKLPIDQLRSQMIQGIQVKAVPVDSKAKHHPWKKYPKGKGPPPWAGPKKGRGFKKTPPGKAKGWK